MSMRLVGVFFWLSSQAPIVFRHCSLANYRVTASKWFFNYRQFFVPLFARAISDDNKWTDLKLISIVIDGKRLNVRDIDGCVEYFIPSSMRLSKKTV